MNLYEEQFDTIVAILKVYQIMRYNQLSELLVGGECVYHYNIGHSNPSQWNGE
jgi:hypothetical protein